MDFQNKTMAELQKELSDLQREFSYLNAIKDIDNTRSIQLERELAVANQEIAYQNEEKDNRAAELIVANKELSFQNEEKAKRAAELSIALAKAEDFEYKFKQIAENIDEVFWLRTDSEMIYVSPSFEKIWGVQLHTIYENPQIFTEIIHPEDKPVVEEIFQSNEFKEQGLFNYEYRILRADNQVRWINAKTVPIVDDSGQIIKRVGIATDVTEKYRTVQELIQAKERAEESDRLKSAFLANMSHEIRTPMNGILGFSELLKKPGLTGEQQHEYIRIIEKSGARMLNIINNIIDISKIEANLMNIDIKNVDINKKIEFVYMFFKPQVEKKGMQLHFKNNLSAKEATLRTDEEKVYSILSNLVKNAIKYSNEGIIEFGYVKRAETLEFYVKDTGIGIPKDRLEAIFQRFVQADISDKMARQGAGLGLSISEAYVEMLGGKIWVSGIIIEYFKFDHLPSM
jgi:PAS domain S-box-containing protein